MNIDRSLKLVIIEDEQDSLEVLLKLLDSIQSVSYQGTADSVAGAIDAINLYQPDLLLLDIELKDGMGFEIFDHFTQPFFQVIFITSYEEYATTALNFGAIDFLLKPVSPLALAQAIKKVHDKLEQKAMVSHQQNLIRQIQILQETIASFQEEKLPSHIAVTTKEDGLVFREVSEIVRFEALDNYTRILFQGRQNSLVASRNFGQYVDQFLPYASFMKVHRSHLVNLEYINTFKKGRGKLYLKDGTEVPVSEKNKIELERRLKSFSNRKFRFPFS